MGNFCGCNDQSQNQIQKEENEQKDSFQATVKNMKIKYIYNILFIFIKVIVK